MISPQLFMGAVVALMCAIGLCCDRWFLRETRKGRRLVSTLGESRAVVVWRVVLVLGSVFGILLAIGLINPIRWE